MSSNPGGNMFVEDVAEIIEDRVLEGYGYKIEYPLAMRPCIDVAIKRLTEYLIECHKISPVHVSEVTLVKTIQDNKADIDYITTKVYEQYAEEWKRQAVEEAYKELIPEHLIIREEDIQAIKKAGTEGDNAILNMALYLNNTKLYIEGDKDKLAENLIRVLGKNV